MELVTTQPKTGQFIAVWQFEGAIWSDTYKWIEGKLHIYNLEEDEWQSSGIGLIDASKHHINWHYVVE